MNKYDFFRENPDLKNIAYLVVSGSRGYGTDNEASDIDLRGFLIEDKKYLFGFNRFEQFEDTPTDTVIYGLYKFISLCCNANPNALELLGVDEDCIIKMSDAGRKVRDNAGLFLSKRIIQSFGNYASTQLRRLTNALCHDQFDAKQQEEYLLDTLKAVIVNFNRTYTDFDSGAVRLYLDEAGEANETEENNDTLKNGILADIRLEKYPLRDFIGIYSEMHEIIKSYDKLNHRNRKKDDTKLFKHAMHLIRMLITGIDILDGRGIITRRRAEHGFLMDIRNGRYTYPEIFGIAADYQVRFAAVAENTMLPDLPDKDKIEKLQIDLYESFL